MELNFRKYLEQNTVGKHNDYASGAFLPSSWSGSEASSDKRGLMPSTDLGIVPRDRRSGVILDIKKKGGRTPDIDVVVQLDNGRTKWLRMSRGEFDSFQSGGTGNAPMARGRRITIDYQANRNDPQFDQEDAQIGKITVH